MPWTCPACNNQIQHEYDRPVPRVLYRCHICRLELVLDEHTQKLIAIPFAESSQPEQPPSGSEHLR